MIRLIDWTDRTVLVAAVLAVGSLGGCVSEHDTMIREGYPLAYADGFDDGCHSGHQAGGNLFDRFKKDLRRFDADDRYAQGWSDGFRQCESQEEAAQRQTRMALEHQRLMDQKAYNDRAEQRHLEREAVRGLDTRGLETLGR